ADRLALTREDHAGWQTEDGGPLQDAVHAILGNARQLERWRNGKRWRRRCLDDLRGNDLSCGYARRLAKRERISRRGVIRRVGVHARFEAIGELLNLGFDVGRGHRFLRGQRHRRLRPYVRQRAWTRY